MTASINFATSQSLTEASTVNIKANDGYYDVFTSTGVTVSGAETTVSAMNMAATVTFVNTPGSWVWSIAWSYKVPSGSNTWIALGSSQDDLYLTWDTPDGSTRTAKRMEWVCEGAQGATSITQAAEKVADAANAGTEFATGEDLNDPIWRALDPYGYLVDCGEGAKLAVYGLLLLGISSAAQDAAWATSDASANPGETTSCSDPNHGTIYLRYEVEYGGYLNNYEGCVTVVDGGTTKYLTVWERNATVAGPWGLLKVLNAIKSANQNGFNQWWTYGDKPRVKDLHDHPNSVDLPPVP